MPGWNHSFRGRGPRDGGRGGGRTKSLYGTEEDPTNCSFFLRMGACRHGENCPKKHNWPAFSNTLLFEHLWIPNKKTMANKRKKDAHYEDFCEDLLEEMMKYGDVISFLTMENTGDHMIGNTFVKFADEDQAKECSLAMNNRFYAGRKFRVRYSPVTDFDTSRCRDFVSAKCKRGNFCNFAHFMSIPRWCNEYMNQVSAQDRVQRKRRKLERMKRSDGWPAFPRAGTREERVRVLEKWNELLNKDKVKKDKPADIKPSALKLFIPGQELQGEDMDQEMK